MYYGGPGIVAIATCGVTVTDAVLVMLWVRAGSNM